jgi:ectoine hydroxylase-related dioxygenase (phytanoyl-CoA dioxygenase family)
MHDITHLRTFGYQVLPNVIPRAKCAEMAEVLEEIAARELADGTIYYHTEAQTVLRDVFLSSPDHFLPLLGIPLIDDVVSQVFPGGTTIQNMHASRPNKNWQPRVHVDTRRPGAGMEHSTDIFAALCVTPFNEETGGTRVWPFSHLSGLRPEDIAPTCPQFPDPVTIKGNPGDILLGLGQLWHDTGPNRTDRPRWGVFTHYIPWWHKPSFDYRDCGPELWAKLSPRQKELLGFTCQVPESRSPRQLTKTKLEDLPPSYDKARHIL